MRNANDPTLGNVVENIGEWFKRRLPDAPRERLASPWVVSICSVGNSENANRLDSVLSNVVSAQSFALCVMAEGDRQTSLLMDCDQRVLEELRKFNLVQVLIPQELGQGRVLCVVRVQDIDPNQKDPIRGFIRNGVRIALISWTSDQVAYIVEGLEDNVIDAIKELRTTRPDLQLYGFGTPQIPIRDLKSIVGMIFNRAIQGRITERLGLDIPYVTPHSERIVRWLFKYGHFGAPRGTLREGEPLEGHMFHVEYLKQHELAFLINYELRCPECRKDLVRRTILVPRESQTERYSILYLREGERATPTVTPEEIEDARRRKLKLYSQTIPKPLHKDCVTKTARTGFARSRIDEHADKVIHALVHARHEALGLSTAQDLDMQVRMWNLILGKGGVRPGSSLGIDPDIPG